MEGNLIQSLIEVATGILIYRPSKKLANSILIWIRTVDLNESNIIDFIKYNFPKISNFIDLLKKKL